MTRTVLLCLWVTQVSAQDTSWNFPDNELPLNVPALSKSKEKLLFQSTFDYWLEAPDSIDIKTRSEGFGLYFMGDTRLIGQRISVAAGLGAGATNIHSDAWLAEDSLRNTVLLPVPNTISYKKNKLTLAFLEIPVEIRLRTNKNTKGNFFSIAAGFRAGYLVNSHTKYKGKDPSGNGDNIKVKSHDVRNILPYRYGVTARIGYAGLNLFGYYGLTEVFEPGNGPPVTPVSIGLMITML